MSGSDDSDDRASFDTNRAWWDERAPIHVGSEFYGLEEFLADPSATRLRAFEPGELGDVAGRTLVHPQCHFGLDTLSWARRGARVTGLDFSVPAVEAARDAATRAGLDAEFLAGNVYDAAELVGGRTFDVVYTGLGALNWLPDIRRWAEVMASLTAPGGVLYLVEFHPLHSILGDEDLTVTHPYFHAGAQVFDDGEGTYADLDAATDANVTVEWTHGLGEVLSAVLAAGYTIELFHEFDHTLFPRWPFLEERDGIYRMPAGMPSLPLMYSLRARR
ncbi:MAG TPA: class I SAM-dependent methyltransferase [Acidimicrobiales bacterium]|nr:class I SAM-dependent methyltransferase [Acidimicrobiales bacterium]